MGALCPHTGMSLTSLIFVGVVLRAFGQSIDSSAECSVEPWGRYSASGGLHLSSNENNHTYLYSFGGDTSSRADSSGGGVVRTNFRYSVETGCWERLADSPIAIGYRATATLLQGDIFYVFGGANTRFQALDHLYKYSILNNTWTEVIIPVMGDKPSARWRHNAVKLSDTTLLVHGGRQENTVLSDTWIFDAKQVRWTMVSDDNGVGAYRHGTAYDTKRDVLWMFGGIDGDFQRHAKLFRWDWRNTTRNITAQEILSADGENKPSRRASHVLDYVEEMDSLVLYGGTCGDMGQLYIYNISANQWCSTEANRRPSLRDAMLWGLQYPNFYMYQGDVICLKAGEVYSIADVHVLDLSSGVTWETLYTPRNERAPQLSDLCDGTNAGACRVPPLLGEQTLSTQFTVCQSVGKGATTPTILSAPPVSAPASASCCTEVGSATTFLNFLLLLIL